MNEFTDQKFRNMLKNSQIRAYFQPIANLEDGTIKLIEARVRWQYSGGEVASAREVLKNIATIKKEGTLDFLVLELAQKTLHELNENFAADIRIAVNFSAATCLSDDFIERLRQFIQDKDLPAFRFRLDIPQQVFSDSHQRVKNLIENLTDRGFEVAIDHVLSTAKMNTFLPTLPVSLIKLDERLVSLLPENKDACNTVMEIMAAATRLGFFMGAEGISRQDQLTWLRQIGCREGQGMLISKPRPLWELMPLLKKGRCW